MKNSAITVQSLSKVFRIGVKEETPDTLIGATRHLFTFPLRNFRQLRRLDTSNEIHDDADSSKLWAVKDISFKIQEGEVVGIIGRNGAGKSTLLKLLSRITWPTSGRAILNGRVSSLLEVGTGFHPELTGRDNIYMNGTILGMTKREIDRKFDEIVDFAGMERFLDTPTKRYSSGMQVRLAFAVAAHLEPEILIIDEVLAVGDAEFQKKCLGKMQTVAESGRTVMFVSHSMAAIESLCTRCLEIHQGELVADGPTREVVQHYRSHAFDHSTDTSGLAFDAAEYFSNATLIDANDNPTNYLPLGGKLRIRMEVDAGTPIKNPQIGIGIDSIMGQRMLTVHTPASHQAISKLFGKHIVECCIPDFPLAPGEYVLKLVLSENREELDTLESVVPFTIADGETFGEGRGHHRGVCVAPSFWSQR